MSAWFATAARVATVAAWAATLAHSQAPWAPPKRVEVLEPHHIDAETLGLPRGYKALASRVEILVNPDLRDDSKAGALLNTVAFPDGSTGLPLPESILRSLKDPDRGAVRFLRECAEYVSKTVFTKESGSFGDIHNLEEWLKRRKTDPVSLLLTIDLRLRKAAQAEQVEAYVAAKLWHIEADAGNVVTCELYWEDAAVGRGTLRDVAAFDTKQIVPALVDAFQGRLAVSLAGTPRLQSFKEIRAEIATDNLNDGVAGGERGGEQHP
ncbi:MAG: hypothetical protein U1E76_20550 [Planctomycetota bacterium]